MLGSLATPIDSNEFARFVEAFNPLAPKLALAVSGGPDSMALAFCAKRWGKRDIVAFIVEHGLRPESPAEAVEVKKRLEDMGIEAEILTWRHDAVRGRVHEKAREARYGLLVDACRRHGASDLLMAHHQGDQAETVLMRLAKGSGIDGLAGIPPINMREDIRLLRPFLQVPKERLIATCDAAGVRFVIDPSNASEKYARGRMRKIMPLLEAEGLSVGTLSLLAQRAREAKEVLDLATREFLKSTAEAEHGGCVRLDREALRSAPRALALRGLAESMCYVHEGAYPPEYAALSSLLDMIVGKKEEEIRTLYGCIASVSEKKITLLREPSAATEVLELAPGSTILWDSRWIVTSSSDASSVMVRALGFPPHNVLDALAPGLRHRIPQGRVRASLPALFDNDKLRWIPSFDGKGPFSITFRKQVFP